MYTDPINRESNIKHSQRLICLPEHQVKNLEKLYALVFQVFIRYCICTYEHGGMMEKEIQLIFLSETSIYFI